MNEWEMRGKECAPEQTASKATKILTNLGFSTTMTDLEQDVENCFSCRLSINGVLGDIVGTNGKGMTKELSHASAYGEMMERLENRLFFAVPRSDDPKMKELINDSNPLYNVWSEKQPFIAKYLKEKIAATVPANNSIFSNEYLVNLTLEQLAPSALNGEFTTLPFYSVEDDAFEYVPSWTRLFCGSNGLAAGNSLEEALVEGLAELIERYSQMQIFDGEIIPPTIPMDYIAQYPHIMKIIEQIERNGKFKVRVLDCSLGKKLPVVCGLISDLETSGFGVKFGAHPNIAIAMERVFTESLQGAKLKQCANYSNPDFRRDKTSKRLDKWNSIKVASSSMPAQLLMDKESYPFVPWEKNEDKTNSEILVSMIQLMQKHGSKIYVRDASYLGFPAVNIYATKFSETHPIDYTELKYQLLWTHVQRYFTRINNLTDSEVSDIAIFAASKRGSVFENSINMISKLFFEYKFMFTPFEADTLYAACLYRLGRTKEAAEVFAYLVSLREQMKDENDKTLIKAVFTWTNAIAEGEIPQNISQVIRKLYPKHAEKVIDIFRDPAYILEKLYPSCGGKPCIEITEGGCRYAAIHDFYKKLINAEKNNPVNPENIRAVFRSHKE